MGGALYNGLWKSKDEWEQNEKGEFERQQSQFRDRISACPDALYPAEKGRYHLYVSYACPWAHRTLLVRALKGLEDVISVSVVHPLMRDNGWELRRDYPGSTGDLLHQKRYLWEIYVKADSDFSGRVTVPVLWDTGTNKIVCNESLDIIKMLAHAFDGVATQTKDLYPSSQRAHIDEVIDAIYQPINNGVYRCGFAGTQGAYEEAFEALFAALDRWDHQLEKQRFLCGDTLTLADICMFTTLLRFDPVYYVHFKCNRRLIRDYKHLSGYLRDVYQHPHVSSTCHMNHIKTHYYASHRHLNPTGIVPVGPELELDGPAERMGQA